MTLITNYTERLVGQVDGTEEFWINVPGSPDVDRKITQASIVASVTTSLNNYITSNDSAVTTLQGNRVLKAGDTMTGFLTLNADPVAALQAATKQYVDNLIANKADATGASFDSTTTGTTALDTTETTALATTEYVASKIGYEVFKKTSIATATHNLLESEKGTILVTRTTTGTCVLTLPLISGVDAERTEYYIVDGGNNAETYSITINCAVGDTFLDGSTSKVLDTNQETILLAIDNLGNWFVKDEIASSSTTREGIARIATNAEALALTQSTAYISPLELGNVFDQEVYAFNELGTASKLYTEADTGVWYVTYTSTGTVGVTLPDPSALLNPTRFVVEIWDAATAGTNNIVITPAGGLIDGLATFTIDSDKAGCKIYTDGVNYFTVANTQRAGAVAAAASNLDAVLTGGNSTGANNISIDSGQDIRFNNGGFTGRILEPTLTSDQTYTLPATGGTIATTGNTLALAGGTMTGNITMATTTQIAFSDGTFTGSFAEATGMASNVVYTLPDVTGTLALTSDITTQLASYLPLAGGTITGTVTFTGSGDIRGNGLFDPIYSTGMLMSSSTSGEVATAASTEWKTNFLRQKVTGLEVGIEQGTGFSADPSTAISISSTDGTSAGSGNNDKLAGLFLNARGGTAQTATTNNVFLGGDGTHSATATTNGNTFVMGTMYQKDLCINDNVLAHSAATAAIPVTHQRVDLTSTTTDACTLANGVTGQRITLVYVAEAAGGDTITITPASLNGYSTITMNDIGDTVELEYGTGGWSIVSYFNVTIA